MNNEKKTKKSILRSAKECAYIATFVALMIALQFAFSAVAGLELVTALFMGYAFVMGAVRGAVVGTCFSLLRQLVFGFFPNVLALYLLYYNLFALGVGLLGKAVGTWHLQWKTLLVILVACIFTAVFTLLDDVISPLWFGYTAEMTKAYFFASLAVMVPQIVCVAISTALLFIPLEKTFVYLKTRLK
ncbi:MAG: hypothetical protein IJ996_04140 [Clostridia bacterium]|nr:hypothetical protein [Clostridia bacterium]